MKNLNVADLQKKILEIVLYFDDFCKKHKITYYLMGGTALGAIRHKGFIPWDDDFDVFMTYDNYQQFLTCCEDSLDKSRFFLQKEDTEEWPLFFSKLRLNGTTFIEPDTRHRHMHKGVYIDIMCLYNVSSSRVFRFLQYFAARLLTAMSLGNRGYANAKSIRKKFAMKLGVIFVRGPLKKGLISLVRCLKNKETKMVGHFFGKAGFSKTCFPANYLGKTRLVPFESTVLPVPEKVESYLIKRFGSSYMEIPDEATRSLYPAHAEFVDLDNSYEKYEQRTM